MKVKTLYCPIFKPFHPPYAKLKSLSLHFFTFSKVSSLSQIKQINFCGTNCGLFKQNYQAKVIQYGYETFQNVKAAEQNQMFKNIYLGARFITNL